MADSRSGYTKRIPVPPKNIIHLGDLGINAAKIKSSDITASYQFFRDKGISINGISRDPVGGEHFFVKDPFENTYQVVEDEHWFKKRGWVTGGTCGCLIGVSDMEKSIPFYRDILGFDRIVYDEMGVFGDFAAHGV